MRPYPAEKRAATKAVTDARKTGELPHPGVYKCHNCDRLAIAGDPSPDPNV